jgi:hypothetical protein
MHEPFMSSDASDTRWLHLLKAGDRKAAQVLWQRYFRLLVGCARQRLGSAPRRAADEEDVALSAFASFCRGVEKGHDGRIPATPATGRRRYRRLLLLRSACG